MLPATILFCGCSGTDVHNDNTADSTYETFETKTEGETTVKINTTADPGPAMNTDVTFPDHNDGEKNTMGDFIGANHIWADYTVFGADSLTEGGVCTTALGSTTIKVYLTDYYKSNYKANIDWGDGEITSAVALAQTGYFKKLFGQEDLKTIVIGSYVFDRTWGHPATYFINSFTGEAKEKEYRAMYDLTYYLCTAYAGTGRTFIIQNWESDWACMPEPIAGYDPPQEVFDRLTEWINTRQDAVMTARRDAGCEDVYVYNCLEVNLVKKAMNGGATVTNNVIDRTYCDFYSYSCYDTAEDEGLFSMALDYLSAKVASNRTGGKSKCYIGEFGYPDSLSGKTAVSVANTALKVAREKKYSHVYWWQMYDCVVSETYADNKKYTTADFMGYWLIKCDGTYTQVWNILYKAINGKDDPNYLATLSETGFPL